MLYRLDIASLTWTKLPNTGDAPKINSSASMTYYSGAFYFFGGYFKSSFPRIIKNSPLLKYDVKSKSWSLVPQTTQALAVTDSAMVVYEGTLYRFQGFNPYEGGVYDIFKINLTESNLDWQLVDYKMERNDSPCDSYAYEILGNKIWFTSGWSLSRLRNDVMELDLGED